ncbi:MAG: hypothetical protein GX862_00055 [Leucobacter sp.]|nr:hypothetical protein [Leucobacter sp.]
MGSLTVQVGDATELAAVSERLDAAGIEHAVTGETLTVNDPWGNLVRVTAGAN